MLPKEGGRDKNGGAFRLVITRGVGVQVSRNVYTLGGMLTPPGEAVGFYFTSDAALVCTIGRVATFSFFGRGLQRAAAANTSCCLCGRNTWTEL